MRKLDKLILSSFLGPFILTFVVVVFILLTQTMMKYFDEFVGKGLGFEVFSELLIYFSINMTPVALPLAVLLSSLMTFGNLGEHFELTAIKSAGISLTRALLPIFIFTVLLAIAAFFNNNNIVPKANLKAYSLLWDIRQKEPSLDLKEGAFYGGIPGYSIKVNEKLSDGGLRDLIIYDHSKSKGNTDVIIADSGRMYTIHNERYLKLDMYKGNQYSEPNGSSQQTFGSKQPDEFVRNSFFKTSFIFSLASFDMQRTDEELFSTNRLMKNIYQLKDDVDSMRKETAYIKYNLYAGYGSNFNYHLKDKIEVPDELKDNKPEPGLGEQASYWESSASANAKEITNAREITLEGNIPVDTLLTTDQRYKKIAISAQKEKVPAPTFLVPLDSTQLSRADSVMSLPANKAKALTNAVGQARYIKNNLMVQATKFEALRREISIYLIEHNKKYSQAMACLVMFLIGAPLGAIIKKGGLGVPVIISIVFFIIYYVVSILGEKWAKSGVIDPALGVWAANMVLLPFGLFFLKQARNDARIFEMDFYHVIFDKVQKRLGYGKEQ